MNDFSERLERMLKAFPSLFSVASGRLSIEMYKRLKPMPSFETWYDPNVPRYIWMDPWFKAVNEAMEYNEKILSECSPAQMEEKE
jgi:hypothetical protein